MSEQNTQQANKALIRRWFEEVWNEGRADAIAEMMSEDCINHGLSETDEPLRGASGFLPFHTQFREAFPNLQVVVEDAIAEGDRVAVRCS
ncbi:MAG TPA: ester cyclase, partial [Pyrinomonadaceae bacterium]|nr:ester cyclase [Pyrinomonadaceae bacterium]